MYIHGIQKLKFMEMIKSPILLLVYKQWGYKSNVKIGNITYPISSPNMSIALATATAYSGNAAPVTTSDCDNDGFSFFMNYTSNFRWIAICW